MASDDPIVRVTDVRVTLDGHVVLDNVSFTLSPGEILTVLGPNGAGKTVLLRALLGVVPHDGTIAWRSGVRIGYVPQRLPYIKDLPVTVADFLALKKRARVDVGQMLREVGLDENIATKRFGDLSSGQYQRVLIAWALSGEPHVLLFDEPTTGVDVTGAETVYGLLERVHRERDLAMIIVTHDLAMVYKLSSTVLCLNREPLCHGPPVATLTPESLRQLYGTEVTPYEHHHHHHHGR